MPDFLYDMSAIIMTTPGEPTIITQSLVWVLVRFARVNHPPRHNNKFRVRSKLRRPKHHEVQS
jgi:hypothetical protein